MNAAERRALVEEVRLASGCSHPIRLRGEMVDLATGEVSDRRLSVACKDRRQVVCPACSALYKMDAWILVSAGLVGGKGVGKEVNSREKLFLTLTAPSFGRVHTVRRGGSCNVARTTSTSRCTHGRLTTCPARHADNDPQLGSPLCFDCYDYRGAVLWNAHVSKLFAHTVRQSQRNMASAGGLNQRAMKGVATFSYLKVAEMQRRGLIHLHVVIRMDGVVNTGPPEWLTSQVLQHSLQRTIRDVHIQATDGTRVRWGQQFDIIELTNPTNEINRVASYVAKYAVKTTDGSKELAYRFRSRSDISSSVTHQHRRRLALTAWDMSRELEFEPLRLRAHAHSFGYTGQLITKSRKFSTTFAALRQARAAFNEPSNDFQVIEGSFNYAGRGYDDPRAVQLAEVFFRMEQELREERCAQRRSPISASHEAAASDPTSSQLLESEPIGDGDLPANLGD
jgi:hypothetical protein